MQHEAIRALYNNVTLISGYGEKAIAMDKNNKVVSWDASNVTKKETELLAAYKLQQLREERNRLITETDWWDASDTPDMTDAQKKYRQDLRDITKTATSLSDVKWPTKP